MIFMIAWQYILFFLKKKQLPRRARRSLSLHLCPAGSVDVLGGELGMQKGKKK